MPRSIFKKELPITFVVLRYSTLNLPEIAARDLMSWASLNGTRGKSIASHTLLRYGTVLYNLVRTT